MVGRSELSLVTYVYSSPVLRAQQTAEILAEKMDIPLEITPALREFDVGFLEGRSDKPAWAHFWDLIRVWFESGDLDARLDGGESFVDIQARFFPFMETLIKRHQCKASEVLLVGHGGLYFCMLPILLGNIDLTFVRAHPIGYTDVVMAEVKGGIWNCSSWCGMPIVPPGFDGVSPG